MQKHKVSHLIRVCDASYDATRVSKEGIEVKDWPFVDGDAPPDAIISQWLELVTRMSEGNGVRIQFVSSLSFYFTCISLRDSDSQVTGIHIHCVAGLGRAPVLVGIALVEVIFRCVAVVPHVIMYLILLFRFLRAVWTLKVQLRPLERSEGTHSTRSNSIF